MERRLGSAKVFKTRWFERFARKQKIGDAALIDAVARAERGQVDADLGGDVTASQKAIGRTSTRTKTAGDVLRLTEKQIEELVKNGDFVEAKYEQEISK